MKDAKQKDRLKSIAESFNKPLPDPPTQMVVTVPPVQPDSPTVKNESQLNVEIPTTTIDRLKYHSFKTRKSLKQLVSEVLNQYLDDMGVPMSP